MQNKTKKLLIWSMLSLGIIFLGGCGNLAKVQDNSATNSSKNETENKIVENQEVGDAEKFTKAEEVGFIFILNFIAIAPPANDIQMEESLYSVLSENAKEQISRENISADVARFIGVQDVPDQGASVEDLQVISDDEVILLVGLNYSGGRILRNVQLIIENGEWKVDQVNLVEEVGQFTVTGNLVKDNPGMEKDVWYLAHEKEGQPALNKKLHFLSSSVCANGIENNRCDLNKFNYGQRVLVIGNEINKDAIEVVRIEFE